MIHCNACKEGILTGGPNTGTLRAAPGEWVFRCDHCDQVIGVRPDGGSWQTILPRLYPSNMPPKMAHEAAEHQGDEKILVSSLMVAAGLRDAEAHDLYCAKVHDAVQRYKDEHPLPRGWFERLRSRLA